MTGPSARLLHYLETRASAPVATGPSDFKISCAAFSKACGNHRLMTAEV